MLLLLLLLLRVVARAAHSFLHHVRDNVRGIRLGGIVYDPFLMVLEVTLVPIRRRVVVRQVGLPHRPHD